MTGIALHSSPPTHSAAVEYYTIELAPLADGGIFVAITATLSPSEGELTTHDLVCKRTESLDAALMYIRRMIIRS